MPTLEQQSFLKREIFSMTLAAMAQRSRLYKPKTPENLRKPFQVALRTLLEELAKSYAVPVAEETHIQNIQCVAEELSAKYQDVLTEGGLRIGLAQKALNLYLKYLWCLGEIPEPPHCPIDSVVLRHVPGCVGVHWTQIQETAVYRDIIEKARTVARRKGQSLPVWELKLFNANVAKR